jgi:hypothetical protein
MKNLIDKYKDKLPESYLEFITKNENFFGYIDDEFGYVHLWDISELHEAWETLGIRDRLDNTWFPIGSNGVEK